MSRARFWAALACITAAAAALPATAAPALVWRAPAVDAVAWRGIVDSDGGSGGAAQMLYPAPNFVGFLAAVLTHAALSAGTQSAERLRQQKAADAVLEPYAAALAAWPARELWQSALEAAEGGAAGRLAEPAEATDGRWLGDATPAFALTQDAATLVLDLGVKLAPPAAPPVEMFVRVISQPLEVADARAHWAADDARALKATAAQLLGHALEIASRQATPAAPAGEEPPFRTHRYLMGKVQRAERSQLVASGCARVLVRTLRGWLLSVPVQGEPTQACSQPYRL